VTDLFGPTIIAFVSKVLITEMDPLLDLRSKVQTTSHVSTTIVFGLQSGNIAHLTISLLHSGSERGDSVTGRPVSSLSLSLPCVRISVSAMLAMWEQVEIIKQFDVAGI
jgi:hypothetical protein